MSKQKISLILAPFSYGGPDKFAKDGPDALLKQHLKEDLEEMGFRVEIVSPPSNLLVLKDFEASSRIKNLDAIVESDKWLAKTVSREITDGNFPLTIGGDHAISIGTLIGVSDAIDKIGVIWLDAHFDYHSPKNTPSWRAHGMPVAAISQDEFFDSHPDFKKLLTIGTNKKPPYINPANIVHIGIGEKSYINPPTKWYSMEDIDNSNIKSVINEAISYLKKRVKKIYVSWDIDVLCVTGTGTAGDSQLTLREGLVIARAINDLRKKGFLAGFEMVEVAPGLEKERKGQTANWASQLIAASFGGNLFSNMSRLKRNINA